MLYRISCAIVLLLALVACATPPPPPPPLLSLDGRECDSAVDFDGAISLEPAKKSKKRYTVTHDVDLDAPCIDLENGEKATYALFRLPGFAANAVLIVGGDLEEVRIFAPNISLLDENGAVSRTFTREDFLFQGVTYGVQLKPRKNERFLLVRAEPEIVGERYDSVTLGIDTTTICTGYFCMNSYSGVDYESTREFSYVGKVSVLIQDLREDAK